FIIASREWNSSPWVVFRRTQSI
ncbi:hypothetical protein CP082626L3_0735B, partial [Chlamydia psittaci 08-2626_L3]